jgi:hypothetical protein
MARRILSLEHRFSHLTVLGLSLILLVLFHPFTPDVWAP